MRGDSKREWMLPVTHIWIGLVVAWSARVQPWIRAPGWGKA